ncbi:hypothetical protein MKX03_034123, partial [Papaver bracteatum]
MIKQLIEILLVFVFLSGLRIKFFNHHSDFSYLYQLQLYFSGLLHDSSDMGYEIAHTTSLPDMVVFCDVQISKDGLGFCLSDIRLDNSTNIANVFPKGHKTYNINGDDVSGWFVVDFLFDDLYNNVSLIQGILTRTSLFDNSFLVKLVDDAMKIKLPNRIWLNVQYDMFYKQHSIDVKSFIQDTLSAGASSLGYISSPEIGFLKSLNGAVTKDVKLVFRFLAADAVEPMTKKTYKAILADLAAIKTFAAGILLGLEVYADGFANDMPGSFNYSYDPTTEYFQFIDNNKFAVDGFLTDFPPTSSEAIGCFALNNKTNPRIGKTLVISHNGASGVFHPCTDLAYQQAVDDGADIIDCSVQITKDGIAFCADSADLTGSTTAVGTFMSKSIIDHPYSCVTLATQVVHLYFVSNKCANSYVHINYHGLRLLPVSLLVSQTSNQNRIYIKSGHPKIEQCHGKESFLIVSDFSFYHVSNNNSVL